MGGHASQPLGPDLLTVVDAAPMTLGVQHGELKKIVRPTSSQF